MKKCANCGLESSDETISCPACSTDTFVSATPQVFGHTISPAEARFWERMTFRQFAVFLIRLQALWFIFEAINYCTYLLDYISPTVHFTRYAYLVVLRIGLHVALAIFCIRYADQIVSWFVKDIIPKPPTISDDDKPAA
jgi:hypothetical protein